MFPTLFPGWIQNYLSNIIASYSVVLPNPTAISDFSYYAPVSSFFKNIGQSRPLVVYFHPFLIPISITVSIIQIEISIAGMLGIRTQACRMVGVDQTPQLWCFSQVSN